MRAHAHACSLIRAHRNKYAHMHTHICTKWCEAHSLHKRNQTVLLQEEKNFESKILATLYSWNVKNNYRFTAREILYLRTDYTFKEKERLQIMENIATAARNAARNPARDVPAPQCPPSTAKRGFVLSLELFVLNVLLK